jgi:hypothetical protein
MNAAKHQHTFLFPYYLFINEIVSAATTDIAKPIEGHKTSIGFLQSICAP